MPPVGLEVYEIRVRRGVFTVEIDRYRIELSGRAQATRGRFPLKLMRSAIIDRRDDRVSQDDPVFPIALEIATAKLEQVWREWERAHPGLLIGTLEQAQLYLHPSYERMSPEAAAQNRQRLEQLIMDLSRRLSSR